MSSLKLSLQLMHHFRIIHFDNKPDNIMLSPRFQKPVFIDFGFSEAIAEELDGKTLVQFRGSPAYCYDEMTAILGMGNTQRYIDVYYNDLHALQTSLSQMKEKVHHHYLLEYIVDIDDE
jgi:serine/threonine protein kinase